MNDEIKRFMRDDKGRFIKGHKALGNPYKKGHVASNTGRTRFKEKEDVGYSALHKWVRKTLGRANKCSKNLNHNSKLYVWANISGEYKRDTSDWHELCHSCNLKDGIKIAGRFYSEGRLI